MKHKKASHWTSGTSKPPSAKRFWVLVVVVDAQFLTPGSEVQAQYKNIDFTGVNYANATSTEGFTVTDAVNYNGNRWDVKVQAPTWRYDGRIETTNQSVPTYHNEKFPNAKGVWFSRPDRGPYEFIFTFTRTAGTDPLKLIVHSGESVDNETDQVVTTGSKWSNEDYNYLSETPILSGQTVTFKDINALGAGWWTVQTTLNATVGNSDKIAYSYTHESSGGHNMVAFQAIPPVDYGDAPPSYDGGDAETTARHTIDTQIGNLYLGSVPPDDDGFPIKAPPWSATALGDDGDTGGDDEDGVMPPTYRNKKIWAEVVVTNDTDQGAYLCCWVDGGVASATANPIVNGTFEDNSAEKRCVDVATNSNTTVRKSLNWYFPFTMATTTYMRCRISTASALSPTGEYSNGEVEDYRIRDILPVELSYFGAVATPAGVQLNWTTESEIENLGFVLERRVGEAEFTEIASYNTDDALLGQGSVEYATDYEYVDKYVEAGQTYEYRLADIDYNETVTYHATRSVTATTTPKSGKVEQFIVLDAYPNPFNPSTTIGYALPAVERNTTTTVQIYDITGKLVKTLLNEQQQTGWHSVVWNGTDHAGNRVPAGVYLSKVSFGSEAKTIKLMLLK